MTVIWMGWENIVYKEKKGPKQEWGQKHMRNWKQRNNLHLYSLKI